MIIMIILVILLSIINIIITIILIHCNLVITFMMGAKRKERYNEIRLQDTLHERRHHYLASPSKVNWHLNDT